jgi:hypothetical protein
MLKNRLNVDLRVIHIQFFAYILSIRACHVAKEHARSDFASEDLLITCDDGTGPRIVSGYQVVFRHAPSGTVILKAWERDSFDDAVESFLAEVMNLGSEILQDVCV